MPSDRQLPTAENDRFKDSPIAWFAEMVLESDRGNFDRAAQAKGQLESLGWTVRYRHPRNARKVVVQ